MPIAHLPPAFLSKADAAEFLTKLGLPTPSDSLVRMVRDGRGPKSLRWGRQYVFRRHDLIAFVASLEERGGAA